MVEVAGMAFLLIPTVIRQSKRFLEPCNARSFLLCAYTVPIFFQEVSV